MASAIARLPVVSETLPPIVETRVGCGWDVGGAEVGVGVTFETVTGVGLVVVEVALPQALVTKPKRTTAATRKCTVDSLES